MSIEAAMPELAGNECLGQISWLATCASYAAHLARILHPWKRNLSPESPAALAGNNSDPGEALAV